MFPHALDGFEYDPTKKLSTMGTNYIWEYTYTGMMFYGTSKIKLSWTLYYNSMSNALNPLATPKSSSEFSMRIYSGNDGMAPYQREALDFVAAMYRGVNDFYGK